jgi:release factor glutamine methyltransferase
MRIASNKLNDLISFYHSELFSVYTPEELEVLIKIVCKHYLGFSPTDIIAKKNENLNQSDVLKLYDCCKDLKKNIPLQYILGETYFYGSVFKVNNSVLIPRPETEELVELILKDCKKSDGSALDILDIGTGSGCIPVSLKKGLPESNVSAIDISQEALEVAQQNAKLNQTPILFNHCDILKPDAKYILDTYDLIISNPPYIAKNEAAQMHERVKNNEPAIALFVDDADATIFYKKIVDLSKDHLNPNGHLYFELNPLFADEVKLYVGKSGTFAIVNLINDLSGNTRFLKAKRNEN